MEKLIETSRIADQDAAAAVARLKEARDSGAPAIGAPQRAGRGKIFAKSLERSTVDLALEFVNLIQNQRGFQANAKTITTTDELLNEVINLKR